MSTRQRVAVVTGGGGGIGAAIAEELGHGGWFVVTVDPLVTLDGSEPLPEPEETTAGRIVAVGGSARGLVGVGDRRRGGPRPVPANWSPSTADSTPSSTSPASPGRPISQKAPKRTGSRCSRCTSAATSTCSRLHCRSWPLLDRAASSASLPAQDGGPRMPARTAALNGLSPPSLGNWVVRRLLA